MERMSVSRFKATCLAVLEKVRSTGEPVVITRFGKVIAEVGPPRRAQGGEGWLGCMRDSGRVVGDVVEPAVEAEEWEVLRS
jgi:antitoxin (DNA-binding transcriptional repressor) of toxin-antitoxin stability system